MSDIDLSKAVDEVHEEMSLEKKAEAKRKIRWVADQILRFTAEAHKLKTAQDKNEERLQKALAKLEELKKGNWNILSQINPQESPNE